MNSPFPLVTANPSFYQISNQWNRMGLFVSLLLLVFLQSCCVEPGPDTVGTPGGKADDQYTGDVATPLE